MKCLLTLCKNSFTQFPFSPVPCGVCLLTTDVKHVTKQWKAARWTKYFT